MRIYKFFYLASVSLFLPSCQVTQPHTMNLGAISLNNSAYSVLKIIDGDTIEIEINNKVQKVRLYGIDTPETLKLGQKQKLALYENFFAQKATLQLNELIKFPQNNKIYMRSEALDKYDRIVATISLENTLSDFTKTLNYQMVKNGFARVAYITPFKGPFQTKNKSQKQAYQLLKEAQNQAKRKKIGIWQYPEKLIFFKRWGK
ncbi:thermonuclease family protein [Mycoplasmopsis sturni]|uniref:thermonuclease family protein n=1 Tax=Mycoplasmopsis sturni TaxID=39047 RepID=UPI00068EB47C|nr:thermonuclease family protein [Mycoplasmopsis sturni]